MGRRGARDEGAIGECARGEYTGRTGCWFEGSVEGCKVCVLSVAADLGGTWR